MKYLQELTHERLSELLIYDADTGVFTWKENRRRVKKGDIAGVVTTNGYTCICIDTERYQAHRLAWLYIHKEWPDGELDHRDQVKNNNRITNLREVTRSENQQNKGIYKNNTSGFKGVYWDKAANKYKAQIAFQSKNYHLGLFNTAEEASLAYQSAAERLHTHRPDA